MADVESCLAPTTGTGPQVFAAAFQFFTAAQCLLQDVPSHDDNVNDNDTFDFIVVGGGSAGSVMAARLSEIADWKILLIEAGSYAPFESKVPSLSRGLYKTVNDWQYFTEDNGVSAQGIQNGSIYWPRAKILGGCSNINGMIYIRGNTNDFKTWYDEGNRDWHPRTVLKYFKKAESMQDQHVLQDPQLNRFYGHDGPLFINTFNHTLRNYTNKILESYNEIGIKNVKDLNEANVMGSGILRATAANGRRSSTDYTYLEPVRSRKNLKIVTDTLVTKIIIDDTTKTAKGVIAEKNGTLMSFFATVEVIISAGTINTPQLLMLSGIGPKAHLESKNINCIVDSPAVGQYLQDHINIPLTIYGNETGYNNIADQHFDAIKYIYNRTGYLAQVPFTDILAFFSRNNKYPEFQAHLNIIFKNTSRITEVYKILYRYKPSLIDSIVTLNKNYALYHFLFNLLHPHSYGNITLKSSDPKEHPSININYFNDSRDLDASAHGLKMLSKIINTSYFKNIGGFLGRLDWEPCNALELDSEKYWKCIALNTATSVYHPVGTARMGLQITSSVVNSKLKVHCVNRLRVVDASVMPSLVSGNTNGPVIMIGERAADLIKTEYHIG
ncbi:hypothetical protein ACJJTC_003823 [Scirpophaga incertulas]